MNRRISIIEDDRLVARVLRRFIERWTGTRPEVVCYDQPHVCARFARVICEVNPPDLVITDGLNGYGRDVVEACVAASVPVIVYTGEPGRFRDLGVEVIAKPDDGALRDAVVSALREVAS